MPVVTENWMNTSRRRPHYHFTSANGWINDPNGLIFHHGIYHLFYQHNPLDTTWGNIVWGHAESRDLIHWQHRNFLLTSGDDIQEAFSGSAIALDDQSFLLVYTGITNRRGSRIQQQYLTRYHCQNDMCEGHDDKPYCIIVNPGITDFRDPFHYQDPDSPDVHALILTCGTYLQIYYSTDLQTWNCAGEPSLPDFPEGWILECPMVIKIPNLPTDGIAKTFYTWMLIVSALDTTTKRSLVYAIPGTLSGIVFIPKPGISWRNIDLGHDFYAPQIWSGMTRTIWIAWMNNWAYAERTGQPDWNGNLTMPRELYFDSIHQLLIQRPVDEMETVFENNKILYHTNRYDHPIHIPLKGPVCISIHTAGVLRKSTVILKLQTDGHLLATIQVHVSMRRQTCVLHLDRQWVDTPWTCIESVISWFSTDIQMELYIDSMTVELFLDGGRHVLTERVEDLCDQLTVQSDSLPACPTEVSVRNIRRASPSI